MRHLQLSPIGPHQPSIEFDWDIDAGTVSGPDADRVSAIAAQGSVLAHPVPWVYELGAEPLKSAIDMAAILGYTHHLPEDLAAAYPQPDEPDAVAESLADDGTVIETFEILR